MTTQSEIFNTLIFCWAISLLIIGPFQVIASLIRAYLIKDWKSHFAVRLKKYLTMLLTYWVAAGTGMILLEMNIGYEWMVFLFVPVLCSLLAIYYWRAVYLLYQERRQNNQ